MNQHILIRILTLGLTLLPACSDDEAKNKPDPKTNLASPPPPVEGGNPKDQAGTNAPAKAEGGAAEAEKGKAKTDESKAPTPPPPPPAERRFKIGRAHV